MQKAIVYLNMNHIDRFITFLLHLVVMVLFCCWFTKIWENDYEVVFLDWFATTSAGWRVIVWSFNQGPAPFFGLEPRERLDCVYAYGVYL